MIRTSVDSVRSPRVSKGYFRNWPSLTVGLLTRLQAVVVSVPEAVATGSTRYFRPDRVATAPSTNRLIPGRIDFLGKASSTVTCQ